MKRSTTRRFITSALAAAIFAGASIGQPSADALRAEVIERQGVAADSSKPGSERLAALDRVIVLHRELVALGEANRMLGEDAVELMGAILSRLAWDGTDVTALYGTPTVPMRDLARQASTEARKVAAVADDWLTRMINEIESGRAGPERMDRRMLAQLRSTRDQRLPVLAARADAILAALATDDNERQELVRDGVARIAHVEYADAPTESRRLSTAGSLLLSGEQPESAVQAFERAASLAPSSATRIEAEVGRVLATGALRGADAGLAVLDEVIGLPPFVIGRTPEPAALALATDARFRLLSDRAESLPAGPERAEARGAAYGVYQRYIADASMGLDEPTRRALALSKIAATIPPDLGSFDDYPPIVQFAAAVALSSSRESQALAIGLLRDLYEGDPARFDALGELKPAAIWQYAAMTITERTHEPEPARLKRAISALLRLTREHPDDPKASEAIEAACAYSQRLLTLTGDPSLEQFVETLTDAIRRFPRHPNVDFWRIELARRLADERRYDEAAERFDEVAPDSMRASDAQFLAINMYGKMMIDAPDDAGRREAASRIIERFPPAETILAISESHPLNTQARRDEIAEFSMIINALAAAASNVLDRPEDAKQHADRALELAADLPTPPSMVIGLAKASQAQTAASEGRLEDAAALIVEATSDYGPAARLAVRPVLASLERGAANAERASDDASVRFARDRMAPAAGAIARWALSNDLALVDEARAVQAEALARSGDGAASLEILDDLITKRGAEQRLALARVDALLAAGRDEEALGAARDIAQRLESGGDHGPAYWRAWARSLQALDRLGPDTQTAASMRSEIARLRVLDQNLGGQPAKRWIESVESSLAAR